jgi:tRNA pseudouridine55 synthase
MATGVVVVAVGEATKLIPWLTAQDKSYEATIALGIETDTLDATGRVVRQMAVSGDLRTALATFPAAGSAGLCRAVDAERRRTTQVPPAFSAIHDRGRRAYARARAGEPITLSAREVRVRRLEVVACSEERAQVEVSLDVEKGYYVRALARDLALALGTVGHLASLRRSRSGPFRLDEAIALDESPAVLNARLLTLGQAAARALPVARLTDSGARDARHGRMVATRDLSPAARGPHVWLGGEGEVIAVGEIGDKGTARVLRVFAH